MKTGFLIVAHAPLGQALYDVADTILGGLKDCAVVDVDSDAPSEVTLSQLRSARDSLQCERIIVLEDILFATPSNRVKEAFGTEYPVIAPLSLPMLLKLVNYRNGDLETLVAKAREIQTTFITE